MKLGLHPPSTGNRNQTMVVVHLLQKLGPDTSYHLTPLCLRRHLSIHHDWSSIERPTRQESSRQMQRRWYDWRFEKAGGCSARDAARKTQDSEVVYRLQRYVLKDVCDVVMFLAYWKSQCFLWVLTDVFCCWHILLRCSLVCRWICTATDHITLEDYEIHDGMGLELYYQ